MIYEPCFPGTTIAIKTIAIGNAIEVQRSRAAIEKYQFLFDASRENQAIAPGCAADVHSLWHGGRHNI